MDCIGLKIDFGNFAYLDMKQTAPRHAFFFATEKAKTAKTTVNRSKTTNSTAKLHAI